MSEKRYCITPTGDRKRAFKLCIQYMNAQTAPPDKWIIVDDGVTDAVESQLADIRIPFEVIRLNPLPGNTLIRNISAAFCRVPVGAKRLSLKMMTVIFPAILLKCGSCWMSLTPLEAAITAITMW